MNMKIIAIGHYSRIGKDTSAYCLIEMARKHEPHPLGFLITEVRIGQQEGIQCPIRRWTSRPGLCVSNGSSCPFFVT